MNVFDKIRHDKDIIRQQNYAEYYSLLAVMNMTSPTASETSQLAELMTALGKSSEGTRQDHARIIALKQHLDNATDRNGKEKRATDAHEKYMMACAERQANFAAMNAKVSAALLERDELSNTYQDCNASIGEIERLKKSDPILHDAVTSPTPTPITTTKKRK